VFENEIQSMILAEARDIVIFYHLQSFYGTKLDKNTDSYASRDKESAFF